MFANVENWIAYAQQVEQWFSMPNSLLLNLLARETGGDNIYNINPQARNAWSGAMGLGQFLPSTWGWLRRYIPWAVDAYNPYQAIVAAGFYLTYLAYQFNSWTLGVMAYNWGPGNVNRWLNQGDREVPAETWGYVETVAGYLGGQ